MTKSDKQLLKLKTAKVGKPTSTDGEHSSATGTAAQNGDVAA